MPLWPVGGYFSGKPAGFARFSSKILPRPAPLDPAAAEAVPIRPKNTSLRKKNAHGPTPTSSTPSAHPPAASVSIPRGRLSQISSAAPRLDGPQGASPNATNHQGTEQVDERDLGHQAPSGGPQAWRTPPRPHVPPLDCRFTNNCRSKRRDGSTASCGLGHHCGEHGCDFRSWPAWAEPSSSPGGHRNDVDAQPPRAKATARRCSTLANLHLRAPCKPRRPTRGVLRRHHRHDGKASPRRRCRRAPRARKASASRAEHRDQGGGHFKKEPPCRSMNDDGSVARLRPARNSPRPQDHRRKGLAGLKALVRAARRMCRSTPTA